MTRKLASLLITASLITAPMLANADLIISNRTNFDSTSTINHLGCSSKLIKGYGITKAHTQNRIPQISVNYACYFHPNDCVADVYMNDSCTGQKVATVVLSSSSGIYQITPEPGAKFKVSTDQPLPTWSINIDPV